MFCGDRLSMCHKIVVNFYVVIMLFLLLLCVFTFSFKKLMGVGVLLLPCTRPSLWCFTKNFRVSVGVASPFYCWGTEKDLPGSWNSTHSPAQLHLTMETIPPSAPRTQCRVFQRHL